MTQRYEVYEAIAGVAYWVFDRFQDTYLDLEFETRWEAKRYMQQLREAALPE